MENSTAQLDEEFLDFFAVNTCVCGDLAAKEYSHAYAFFNFLVIIVLIPIVATFGAFTNIANVSVFTRPCLRNSGNAYLLGLACSDFFVVLTAATLFWVDSARSYVPFLGDAPFLIVHVLPLSYVAQTCSIYFTVFAAVDCFFGTVLPFLAPLWCRNRVAYSILGGTILGSIAYNFPRFWQLRLHVCYKPNETIPMTEICPTQFFLQSNTAYNVYCYMVLMTFLPFFLLLGLNICIVGVSLLRPRQNSSSDTTTLIMVVVMFLCCNILALVVNIVETFFNVDVLVVNFLTDASNFLVIFNSSVNFVIYIVFMKDYRETFLRIFCGRPSPFPAGANNGEGYILVAQTNGIRPVSKAHLIDS